MKRFSLSLFAFLFLMSCDEDSIETTYSFSGYAKANDERDISDKTEGHEGFIIRLELNGKLIQETSSANDGSFLFSGLDSIPYDLIIQKEGYAETRRLERYPKEAPYYIWIPSIPIYYPENATVAISENNSPAIISIDVKNFIMTRYDPKYFRIYLSPNPNISPEFYDFTTHIILYTIPGFHTVINDTDAHVEFNMNLNQLNKYESGRKIYFRIYTTSSSDPFVERPDGKIIYTGLSEKFAASSAIIP